MPCISSLYSSVGAVVQYVVLCLLLATVGTCARFRPVPAMQVGICKKAPIQCFACEVWDGRCDQGFNILYSTFILNTCIYIINIFTYYYKDGTKIKKCNFTPANCILEYGINIPYHRIQHYRILGYDISISGLFIAISLLKFAVNDYDHKPEKSL